MNVAPRFTLHDAVPFARIVVLHQRGGSGDAGIVDQHVQATERLDGPRNHGFDGGEVRRGRTPPWKWPSESPRSALSPAASISTTCNARARLDEGPRDFAADAGGAGRDQHFLHGRMLPQRAADSRLDHGFSNIPSLAGMPAARPAVTLAACNSFRSASWPLSSAGIATSHTPTIGFALDAKKQQDPVWAPIFAGYEPVKRWLAEKKPDVLFFIYNDHITSFFFDHYSHFALGVGEKYWVADEGGGARKLPPIKGHPALARHVANGLVADEFDLSFFQEKGLDHGCFSPLSLLWPHEKEWPGAIVPLQVGVLQLPIPSARRCFKLGRSRCARPSRAFPKTSRWPSSAPGGLSHQIQGERAGFNNTPWDMEFLELLEKDPEKLTEITIAEYADKGRHGRLRSHHVAGDARRARAEGEEAAPGLLPAVDDADRHRDLRERLDRAGCRIRRRLSRAHQSRMGRPREAARAPIRSRSIAASRPIA